MNKFSTSLQEGNFFQAPNELVRKTAQLGLTPTQVIIILHISSNAEKWFLSDNSISAATGLDRKTIRKNIEQLISNNKIAVKETQGYTRRFTLEPLENEILALRTNTTGENSPDAENQCEENSPDDVRNIPHICEENSPEDWGKFLNNNTIKKRKTTTNSNSSENESRQNLKEKYSQQMQKLKNRLMDADEWDYLEGNDKQFCQWIEKPSVSAKEASSFEEDNIFTSRHLDYLADYLFEEITGPAESFFNRKTGTLFIPRLALILGPRSESFTAFVSQAGSPSAIDEQHNLVKLELDVPMDELLHTLNSIPTDRWTKQERQEYIYYHNSAKVRTYAVSAA